MFFKIGFRKKIVNIHNFIKVYIQTQLFSCEYSKIFKNTFFIEHFCWLLLDVI